MEDEGVRRPIPPERPRKWTWTKVSELHRADGAPPCGGSIHTYVYRHYPAESTSHERCIGLAWCSTCRDYSGNMVYVPRAEKLENPLAALGPDEQRDLHANERRLIDRLDRMVRRGDWTPGNEARTPPLSKRPGKR
jgi:hypothetical protein